jgi:hypothetical protein
MGEYIELDGRSYKIGTCESLYYCRYDDLCEWVRAARGAHSPGNDEPREYLKGAYRFRFPFPDEDGPEAERIDAYCRQYDRGVTFAAPAELFADVEHSDLCRWIVPGGIEYAGLNVFIPCPAGPDFGELKHSPTPTAHYLQVKQQRPFEGALWAVVGCAWCGSLWRLTAERARILAEYIITPEGNVTGYDQVAELARRIVAGYETATEAKP